MENADSVPYKIPDFKTEQIQSKSSALWRLLTWQRLVFWTISLLIILMVIAMLMPVGRSRPVSKNQIQCSKNLRQIVLATHEYAEDHGRLPPAFTVDDFGNPLHSWRVLILPYLRERALYNTIDLTKPWDHYVNAHARKRMPQVFMCPSNFRNEGHSTYLANAWAEGAFVPAQGRSWDEFGAKTEEIVLVFEVPHGMSVEWMSPQDGDAQTYADMLAAGKPPHSKGTNMAFADTHIESVHKYAYVHLGGHDRYFTITDKD